MDHLAHPATYRLAKLRIAELHDDAARRRLAATHRHGLGGHPATAPARPSRVGLAVLGGIIALAAASSAIVAAGAVGARTVDPAFDDIQPGRGLVTNERSVDRGITQPATLHLHR